MARTDQIVGVGRQIDPPGFPTAFHPARNIYRIAENVVDQATLADDPRDHAAGVQPDADMPLHGSVPVAFIDASGEGECAIDSSGRRGGVCFGHSRDRHIGVADCFDFLQTVMVDDIIEFLENLVQLRDEMGGRHDRDGIGESFEVGEDDGHVIKAARFSVSGGFDLVGSFAGKDVVE